MDSTQIVKRYQVTYDNPLTGTRKVLIDDIDADTATAVLCKWGDPSEPNFYMPGARIEPMPANRKPA